MAKNYTVRGIGFTNDSGWQVLTDSDLFNNRLERLIFTKEGGILGHPETGSLVLDFLNDPDDTVSHFDIMNEIGLLIEEHEPDLRLIEASVNSQNIKDIGNVVTVKLHIEYTVTDEVFDVEFFKVRDVG